MQVINRQRRLQNEFFDFSLRDHHAMLVLDENIEVTLVTILKENAEHLLILEAVLEPTDVRMA